MIKQAANAITNKPVDTYDWSLVVGEEGVEFIQTALNEVEDMLIKQGVGDMTRVAMVAVESYAYQYVDHLRSYLKDLGIIPEINPEALVIAVGMNNALDGVELTMGEAPMPIGEYIGYLVEAANLEAYAYALMSKQCVYVNAPDVETIFAGGETSLYSFIATMVRFAYELKATDAGHEYIKEQICKALTVSVYDPSNDNESEHTHTESIVPGKKATCTETGLTEGKKCSICGEILIAQEVIEKVDHTWMGDVCSVCGKVKDY